MRVFAKAFPKIKTSVSVYRTWKAWGATLGLDWSDGDVVTLAFGAGPFYAYIDFGPAAVSTWDI